MPKRLGSGRKRVPVERKVLEGRFRKDRHGSPPRVKGGKFPEPGEHLGETERQLWAEFPRAPWIVETDALTVQAAVCIYQRILEARVMVATEPGVVKYVALEAQLWGRLMTILSSLGLTPADRGKMTAPKEDDAATDKWAGVF